MSTRAVITFVDERDSFHVYKHSDGYPDDVLPAIGSAIDMAWPLPRFEAADFAAAFVAANKKGGGGIYFTSHYDAHGDLDYRYEVRAPGGKIDVRVFKAEHDWKAGTWQWRNSEETTAANVINFPARVQS